jgi:hypothetical protein
MSQDLSKGKIYKITNDRNDDVYIGSTCDTLVKRFSYHKRGRNSLKRDNHPLYSLMKEIGTERFAIYLVESYPCENKYELGQREGFWIRQIGTLNKRIEGRTSKEYYEDNKEKRLEQQKEYYRNNTEKIKLYQQQYKEENLWEIKCKSRECGKTNYINNKEKINEKHRLHYLDNKEKLSQKIVCDCGCEVSKYCLVRHKKTKKHIELMTNI